MSTFQKALPTVETIDELLVAQGDRCVSIIMPTHVSGRQVKQNAIRFKNLLSKSEQLLLAQGGTEVDAEKLLQPLAEFEGDDDFWQHQSAGVAFFLAEGRLTTVALHDSPAEYVLIAEHFYLIPVALDAASQKNCLVLTLTWEEAKLYRADRTKLQPMENEEFPVALRDVVLPPDPEEQLQFRTHSTNTGGTMFHGQGAGEAAIQSDRGRFLSEVGKRLRRSTGALPRQLVVVGTDEVVGEFKSATSFTPEQMIFASPDGLDPRQLNERVLAHINQDHDGDNNRLLREHLGTALASNQASRDLQQIIDAATAGRVQSLLVNTAIVAEGQVFEDDKLQGVNLAVIRTLQNGGEILAVTDDVLDSFTAAAMYRY